MTVLLPGLDSDVFYGSGDRLHRRLEQRRSKEPDSMTVHDPTLDFQKVAKPGISVPMASFLGFIGLIVVSWLQSSGELKVVSPNCS